MEDPQPVTRAQIEKAITWYKANRNAIAAALPLRVPGMTYKKGWPDCIDRQIAVWESNKAIPLNLAVIYIYYPICVVRDALKKPPY
ncbi:MAG: hypothetical protein WA947_08185 [Phormidesmis sp.]